MKTPGTNPIHAIVILALVQALSASWFLRIDGFYAVNSIVFLFCGLAISFFILRLDFKTVKPPAFLSRQLWIKLGGLLLLLPVSYYLSRRIMDGTPLQKEYADMLPVMRTMGERFLQGEWSSVYDPIPEIWSGIQPIYLPGFWLPFTPSLIFHFDMRWITVCGIWLSVLICIWPGVWKKQAIYFIYVSAILALLAWLHFDKVNNVIRLTQEGVVFFYYSLLAVGIILKKGWWVGIAAALCLLSRYAMIGWIPFAFICLLARGQYRFLLEALIAGSVLIVLLVIIPFGWKPFWIHLQLHTEYISHATRIWRENPEYFTQPPGMAKFFGPARTQLLHSVLLFGSFILPLGFLFLAKKKSISPTVVLLAGFQFVITFFYSFVDVSYLYLYYTPVFVSLVIAGWVLPLKKALPA